MYGYLALVQPWCLCDADWIVPLPLVVNEAEVVIARWTYIAGGAGIMECE